jgi:hypothetical protein
MWMMTKIGFYSIVEKPTGTIQIRSRSDRDLQLLIDRFFPNEPDIITTLNSDYRYRIIITKDTWMKMAPFIFGMVDYPNFKNEVYKDNPMRATLYHQVWHLLSRITFCEHEEKDARRKTKKNHNKQMESDDDD